MVTRMSVTFFTLIVIGITTVTLMSVTFFTLIGATIVVIKVFKASGSVLLAFGMKVFNNMSSSIEINSIFS